MASYTKNTDNYTLGQVGIYFSTTVADPNLRNATFLTATNSLGNIVTAEIAPNVTFIEHYISDRGIRKKDKTAINLTNVTIPFTFDEMDSNNLKRFFMASDIGGDRLAVMEEALDEGSAVLKFDTSVGKDLMYYIPKCQIRPDGNLQVNAEDWWKGNCVLDILYYDTTSTPWDNAPLGFIDTTAL